MNKNTKIIIGVVALIVIVGSVYASMNNKENNTVTKEAMEQKSMEDKAVMQKNEVVIAKDEVASNENMMKKDETSTMEKPDTMMSVGTYEAYSPEKIARAEDGDVVLFFHASWCPSCRGLNTSIESNMKSIPAGVTILKTDYDKETELKKKYGVTYQHTLVQVDKNGNVIKKWSGSGSLDNLLSQIQ